MINVIKTLESKISEINQEIEKAEKRMEEPEMVCDYEFALNDAANLEKLKIEYEQAINLINQNL